MQVESTSKPMLRFRKRYLSCNRFARKYFVRVRCLKKLCSLFINMAFVTDVREFQAALSACLTARVFRSVSHALDSTFNPRFAYKLERGSSTIEITTIEVRSAN